jgi:hypothetical protein
MGMQNHQGVVSVSSRRNSHRRFIRGIRGMTWTDLMSLASVCEVAERAGWTDAREPETGSMMRIENRGLRLGRLEGAMGYGKASS